MGSTLKNKIHTIEVENNETQSVEKILAKIREDMALSFIDSTITRTNSKSPWFSYEYNT